MPVNKPMSTTTVDPTNTAHTTAEQASRQFALAGWSEGYFGIDAKGRIIYQHDNHTQARLPLVELMQKAADLGLHAPLLMRFPDILSHRIKRLSTAFSEAYYRHGYRAPYTVVYPIKVNQQRCVVEQIIQTLPGRVGLEVGSKPELMAVLAQTFYKNTKSDFETIICNGYKDREYIRLALIGAALGKRIFIVIEKPDELSLVLQQAQAMSITPRLGVRVRLSSIAKGKWQNSGGEKSKFGLSAVQLLALLEQLREQGGTEYLQLLHFHVGSQIADLADLRKALQEAVRVLQELHHLQVPISVFDVGGGLSVDYQGSRSDAEFSMNYGIEDYADAVVAAVAAGCRESAIDPPEIITESGRALTAHHAVLISNVLSVERLATTMPSKFTEHPLISRMQTLVEQSANTNSIEQAQNYLQQSEQTLQQGYQDYLQQQLDLAQRAALEALRVKCQQLMQQRLQVIAPKSEVLKDLNEKLADKYICNFSLFQSLPDAWGIGQVFPVLPLQRLNEPLDSLAVIHDLTCDSDGQLLNYPLTGGLLPSLPVHKLGDGKQYYIGIFMLGAYQEVLGDMHNLFGDTNAINIRITADGGYQLEGAEPGDRIDQLLEYLHYDTKRLLSQYKRKLNRTKLSKSAKQQYYLELAAGLSGYTYLEE